MIRRLRDRAIDYTSLSAHFEDEGQMKTKKRKESGGGQGGERRRRAE